MPKHSGKWYINEADKAENIKVIHGKGDHYKFYGTTKDGEEDFMVCPYNLESSGVESKVRKFLIKMGVIIIFCGMLWVFYQAMIIFQV